VMRRKRRGTGASEWVGGSGAISRAVPDVVPDVMPNTV